MIKTELGAFDPITSVYDQLNIQRVEMTVEDCS